MADPTAPVTHSVDILDLGISKGALVNAEQAAEGAHVSFVYGAGTIQNTAAEANAIPAGHIGTSPNNADKGGHAYFTGTNNADETDPQVNALGARVKEVAVTGVASYADRFKLVYASDGQTYALTRPSADAVPVGYVFDMTRDNTTTTCRVYFFDLTQSVMLGIAGGTKRTIYLGSVHTTILEGTSAVDIITDFVLYGHGLITKFYARPDGFDASYAAGDQNLNLEIGTTDVTGGVLNLLATSIDGAADVPVEIAATAITAANEFHDGDVLSVEMAASGTGFTAAVDTVRFNLFIDVQYLPGA